MTKRKSSFGRRRSRSLVGFVPKDLSRTIDKSLPSSERLQLLFQYGLETALSKASHEVSDDMNLEEFLKSASQCQMNIESKLEAQNLYTLAESNNEITYIGTTLDNKYAEYNNAVDRLEEENKQWDQLIAKYRSDLVKQANLTVITFKGSVNYKRYNLPNYSRILEDVSQINEDFLNQMEKLKVIRNKSRNCVKLIEKYTSSINAYAESQLENKIKESPKELIRHCF